MADVACEESEWELGGRRVRLAQAVDLAAAVDIPAQLGAPSPAEPPYWMHLWPGAVALARLVATSPTVRSPLRVIELGCGLALPAVTAAVCGAKVVAADRILAPLQYARRSAERSGSALAVVQMDWSALAFRGSFDLCLGADIGYDFGRAAVLAEAFRQLLRPGGRVWLADSVNIHRDDLLVALRDAGFTARCSETQEQEEGRPVWVRRVDAQVPA